MSTMGLAGLALVVLAAATVLVLALRRRVIMARRPRTVADLVRLQDGTPTGRGRDTAAGFGMESAAQGGSSPHGAGFSEPDRSLVPELDETGDDTPWRRAARMAGTPLDPAPAAAAAPWRFRVNGSRRADRVPMPPRRVASTLAAVGSAPLLIGRATRPAPAPITTVDGEPPIPSSADSPEGPEPALPGPVTSGGALVVDLHLPPESATRAPVDTEPAAEAEPAAADPAGVATLEGASDPVPPAVESEDPRGLGPARKTAGDPAVFLLPEAAAEPAPADSGSEDGLDPAGARDLPAGPTGPIAEEGASSTGADPAPDGARLPQPITAAEDDPPRGNRSDGRRLRRTPDEHAAEQASVDIALLRTFGFADPSAEPDSAPVVSLTGVDGSSPEPVPGGAPQPVRAHAMGRDGAPVADVAVTLLDDRGREAASGTVRVDGGIELQAPRPGTYVLVAAAPGHQAGAVAVAVAEEPAEVELLLVRSASVCGAIRGEHGLLAGARVALVQDGEIVETVESSRDGAYRIGDLAAGGYGLSVAAEGCAPTATLLSVLEGTDVRHDIDLDPAPAPAHH